MNDIKHTYHTYHVTYYYLATGMEGYPDIRDYGHVLARSAEHAKEIVGFEQYPHETSKMSREWGLWAKRIK